MTTVKATPSVGWNFNNWKENNIVVSNTAAYSFVILNSRNLTATFSKKIFTISTSVNPADAGTTTGDGLYSYDSTVTLFATPNIGWEFVNWTENGNVVYSTPQVIFKATIHRTLVAQFKKKVYPITTVANTEKGGVTYGDSVITHGDNITVSAVAFSDSGYDFINWSENGFTVSTESIYSFTVTGPRNLVANFQLRSYQVQLVVNPANSGTTIGQGSYTHGDNVEIIAVPEAGWSFANWTENSVNIDDSISHKFVIYGNKTFTANFGHDLYDIVATSIPVESGFVTGSGKAFYGQNITLIANPNVGWDFDNWTENGSIISTNQAFEFSVEGNRNLNANFSLKNYSISCSANPSEGGITSGCGISHYGNEMILNASPNNGWEFDSWTENEIVVSTLEEYIFNVDRDRDLVANFKLLTGIERMDNSETIPENYFLSNAYPNPFNPTTNIRFGLPEPSEVNIFVFNLQGQITDKIIDNVYLPAGTYITNFNASEISSGIYFYRIFTHSLNSDKHFSKVGKFVLVK